jgi:hypothetical protein
MVPVNIADQAQQLSDLFRQLSMSLDQYRAANAAALSAGQRQQLADNAQHLDDFAEQFTGQAIQATVTSIQGNIKNIIAATQDAQKAIKKAALIEKVASIAAAAVALGAGIATGNPETIASAADGLVSAIGGNGGGNA